MPLHLLGKKSWNVYNTANIEKVRNDEAVAAAREAGEDQRMQEEDAHHRLQILRGEKPESLESASKVPSRSSQPSERGSRPSHERKRKRITGEDDTARDIRYALERAEESLTSAAQAHFKPKPSSDAPLLDSAGHFNLFPPEKTKHLSSKNTEAEAEAAKKKREYEDQYTMRFSNAAGFKQSLDERPWYFDTGSERPEVREQRERPSEQSEYQKLRDQRKAEKTRMKISADDPLSAMRQGVQGLREVERSKTKAKEERKQELHSVNQDLRRRKRSRREDSLEDFHLDNVTALKGHRSKHHKRHVHHEHHEHHEHHVSSRLRHEDTSRHHGRDR